MKSFDELDKKRREEISRLLNQLVQHCDAEDRSVRERQIRTWRRLKLFWEGFQRVWYSEVAHDWRIWDIEQAQNTDQAYYDKTINVFRAYLESIIAALSITVPPVKCYPDDADNPLDLATAKAGDKTASLIYRHNNIPLLWLHALFVFGTEGLIAAYTRPVCDKKFGTYNENEVEESTENHKISTCPLCGMVIDDQIVLGSEGTEVKNEELDEANPGDDDVELHNILLNKEGDICPNCAKMIDPEIRTESFVISKIVGTTTKPKTRIKMGCYGGLNVKVSNYARTQEECGYLQYSFEKHYALVFEEYKDCFDDNDIKKLSAGNTPGAYDQYEQWGRLSPQYQNTYPDNVVTEKHSWVRPGLFNILKDEKDIEDLKRMFPDGVHVVHCNDILATACNSDLDDEWTLSYNPLAQYLHHDPLGMLLVSIQEITNDITSLTLQTIEHGVGLTFADPAALNFKAFETTEVTPGAVFPATAKSGKGLSESFHELKTATLSGEVMPFAANIQSQGQIVSGALPSIYGGELSGAGGDTASGYSMSRAQALQRLQNTWKMLTMWWKDVFGKAIPMMIKEFKEDEREVERDSSGNFINVFIRMAELQGKIGKVELEANENLPLTWSQKKDVWMSLLQNANQQVMQLVAAPENLNILREAIGLEDVYVPGDDDRIKQYEEIQQMLQSEPIPGPADPQTGQPAEHPSVDVDPILDNHAIEFEICRKWAISDAGRLAKIENPNGYKNVIIHAYEHYSEMQQQMMEQQMTQSSEKPDKSSNVPRKKENKKSNTPIKGEGDVQTIQ